MEAHSDVFAVFHVYAAFSNYLPSHNLTKTLRDEDSAGISFDHPREALPVGVCFDRAPYIEEYGQIHVVLCVWPSNALWISNLHETACIGVQRYCYVTENHPTLACKDVCLQLLRLLDELNVHAFLLPTSVTDSH